MDVTYPEIGVMQTRAIIQAAINVNKETGMNIVPEIMVPLVGEVKELKYVKDIIVKTAEEEIAKAGVKLKYEVGTMIEIPRAALTADEIAKEAEFFSFGTNDLTQMTFGFSRDDAGKFLDSYYDNKIYENDPFAKIDQVGVGKLVKMACDLGKQTRPDIKLGICGEHGGDPSTVEFCHNVGLTYVSCHHFVIGAVTVGTLFKNPAKFPGAYGVFAFIITFATDVRQEFLPAQRYPFPAYSVHRTAAQGRFYLIIITMHSERPRVRLHDRTFELAVPHREIIGKIEALAARINADYGDGSRGIPLFVGVLNGAFMFFAELLQRISFPCEVSFVRLTTYPATTTTGSVTEVFGLRENIEARHVIVVEDIVETGESIRALTDSLAAMNPATLEVATLLFKPASYRNYFPIRYPAMEISDGFIVGFGLDYDGLGRNLCDIYRLAKEV